MQTTTEQPRDSAAEPFAVNQLRAAEMLGVTDTMIRKLVDDGKLAEAEISATCKRYLVEDLRALFRRRQSGKEASHGCDARKAG